MADKEVDCPECGHVNEYDPENDTLLCDECDSLIFINDEDEDDGQ